MDTTLPKDAVPLATHGALQWKGTEACIDIWCVCGKRSHYDGGFLYNWRCAGCNRVYAMDPGIDMTEIPPHMVPNLECVQGDGKPEREISFELVRQDIPIQAELNIVSMPQNAYDALVAERDALRYRIDRAIMNCHLQIREFSHQCDDSVEDVLDILAPGLPRPERGSGL